MKPTLKRILLGLSLVGVVVLLILFRPSASTGGRERAPEGARDDRLLVRTHVVEPGPLSDRIVTTGTILANEDVELRSEASGRVTDIRFEEGRPVRKGQLLVKVNDEELKARLRQAEYRLTRADNRERRLRELLDRGGVSEEEYESILSERNVQQAEIELIRAQIDKTEIRAPFDGIVGLRRISEGSYLSPTTPIARLQDLDPVRVEFSIPERYARRVGVGDRISFTVEGAEGRFDGTIYAVDPQIDENTRTLRVRARAPNPDLQLLPGGFATIELVFNELDDALTIPTIAVVPELGGQKVFVYEEGQAQARPVQTGIRLENQIQITDGLSVQDTVITSGVQQLRPGLPVRLRAEEALEARTARTGAADTASARAGETG